MKSSDYDGRGLDPVYEPHCDCCRHYQEQLGRADEVIGDLMDQLTKANKSDAFHIEACAAHQKHIDELREGLKDAAKSERNIIHIPK